MGLDIATMLAEIGLTNNESIVYSYILNHPDLTASQISKRCMLDKSSTYRACEDLVKKNLLVTSPLKNGLVYKSLSPASLYDLINIQESQLRKKKEIISEIVKNINSENSVKTQISVEYGEEALEKWMNECLDCKSGKIYQLLHKFSNIYRSESHREFNKMYVTQRNEKKIKLFLLEDIAPNMTVDLERRKQNEFKEIRIIPKDFEFKHSLIIFDNTTVIQTFGENGEIVVTVIQDKYSTEMFLGIFNYIWSNAEVI